MIGRARGLARAAVLIGILTILARVAGFGRTVVFSATVGSNCLSDAYFTANQIPNIIFEIVVGGALASMVVPVLAGPIERGAHQDVARTASAMLTWVVAALTPLAVLAAVFAGPLMRLIIQSPGQQCVRADFTGVATRMLVVFAPQVVLYGLAVVLYGVLQAYRRFTGPALAPLVSSLVVIAAYLAYVPAMGGHSPYALAHLPAVAELTLSWGTTAGVLALVLTAALAALPVRLRLRPTFRFPPGVAVRVRGLALAGVATVAAQQLAMLAVVILKGKGSGNALTNYQFAWAVFLLPWAILAVPIATSAFPVLSARISGGEGEAFDRIAAATTRAVVLVSCAGAAALAAVAWPVGDFFLGRNQPESLAWAVFAFAPGLVGYGLVAHLGRALFACGQGRASAGATVIGWLAVLVADIVLVNIMPGEKVVAAFGLGNTVGMTVAGVLLVAAMARTRGAAPLQGLGRVLPTGAAGAVAGGALGYGVADVLGIGGRLRDVAVALVAALAAAAVFAVIVYLVDGRDLKAVLTRKVTRDE